MVLNPGMQASQNRFIFLYHEQPGPLLRADSQILSHSGTEVALFRSVGDVIGTNDGIAINIAHPNDGHFFSEWTRLVAKKSFIQTHLGLRAEVIMQTRKHNDYLISRIRGFTD